MEPVLSRGGTTCSINQRATPWHSLRQSGELRTLSADGIPAMSNYTNAHQPVLTLSVAHAKPDGGQNGKAEASSSEQVLSTPHSGFEMEYQSLVFVLTEEDLEEGPLRRESIKERTEQKACNLVPIPKSAGNIHGLKSRRHDGIRKHASPSWKSLGTNLQNPQPNIPRSVCLSPSPFVGQMINRFYHGQLVNMYSQVLVRGIVPFAPHSSPQRGLPSALTYVNCTSRGTIYQERSQDVQHRQEIDAFQSERSHRGASTFGGSTSANTEERSSCSSSSSSSSCSIRSCASKSSVKSYLRAGSKFSTKSSAGLSDEVSCGCQSRDTADSRSKSHEQEHKPRHEQTGGSHIRKNKHRHTHGSVVSHWHVSESKAQTVEGSCAYSSQGTGAFAGATGSVLHRDSHKRSSASSSACRWHTSALSAGDISDDGRVFTKTMTAPRKSHAKGMMLPSLFMIFESNLRTGGLHSYTYKILRGSVGPADGVGFVFDTKVRRSNIQKMRSVFINKHGQACIRNMGQITKFPSSLPKLNEGMSVSLQVDLDRACARFQMKDPSGNLCGAADLSYASLLPLNNDHCQYQSPSVSNTRSGFFCAIVTGNITVSLQ